LNIFIVDHLDELIPFLVEELDGAMLEMLMRRFKVPITWWSEIRMDKLHDEKVMDPHGFVMSFGVSSVPGRSDATFIDATLPCHNFCE